MTVFLQLKRLSKDTLFYGLGSTLQKFIGFLLFPIYTRVLTTEDMGTQDLVLTAFSVIFSLSLLGLDNGAARSFYDADTAAEKQTVLSSWLWFGLAVVVPLSALLFVFAEPVSRLLFGSVAISPSFRLVVATLPFSMVARVALLALRLTFQSSKFSIVATAGGLFQALLAIYLVAVLRLGVTGVFWAYLLGNVVQMVIGLVLARAQLGLRFSGSWLRAMLGFGLPTVPASMSLWILNSSNRYFMARLTTLGEIGLFSVAVRISTILTFVISAFLIAWPPFAFSLLKDRDLAKHTYARTLTLFLLASLTVAVVIGVWAREAILIFATPAYERAAPLVAWLCLSAILWGAADIVGIGFSIAKKSYHITVSTVLGAAVNIGVNAWLIPIWGLRGAIVASLVGNLAIFAYSYFMGQRYFHVNYPIGRILALVSLATLVIGAGLGIDWVWAAWNPLAIFFKLVVLGAFAAGVLAFRIIGRQELGLLWSGLVTRMVRRQSE